MNTDTETPSTTRNIGPVTLTTTGAAAVTTIGVWILGLNGIEPPPEVQGAITAIVVFLCGWFVPSKRGKRSL